MEETTKKTDGTSVILYVGLIASSVLLVYTLGMKRGYKLAIKTIDSVINSCVDAFEISAF